MAEQDKNASPQKRATSFHVIQGIRNFLSIITISCFIGMFLIVLGLVFMRFVLQRPFIWGEEAARYLMVISLFFAISMGVKEKAHLNVEFFVSKFPPKISRILLMLAGVITTACYLFLSWLAVVFVLQVKTTNQSSAALRIPSWILYCFLAFGFILCVVESVIVFYNDFFRPKLSNANEESGGDEI